MEIEEKTKEMCFGGNGDSVWLGLVWLSYVWICSEGVHVEEV